MCVTPVALTAFNVVSVRKHNKRRRNEYILKKKKKEKGEEGNMRKLTAYRIMEISPF